MLTNRFAAAIALGLSLAAPAHADAAESFWTKATPENLEKCEGRSNAFVFLESRTKPGELEPTFTFLSCFMRATAETRCKNVGWLYKQELNTARNNPPSKFAQRNLNEWATALSYCPAM